MGTRNLICIFYKGRFMVAQYSQWDGYLEGQGWKILQFLLVPGNIERLKAGLDHIYLVDDETVSHLTEPHAYATYDGENRVCKCGAIVAAIGWEETCLPPTLIRDTGAKIFDIIASARSDDYVPIHLSLEFALDALFCEYAYCVDLDEEVFELFGGAVHNPKLDTKDDHVNKKLVGQYRFAAVDPEKECVPKLLKSFPFNELPIDLDDMLAKVAACNPSESDYEKDEQDENVGEDMANTVDSEKSKEDGETEKAAKE